MISPQTGMEKQKRTKSAKQSQASRANLQKAAAASALKKKFDIEKERNRARQLTKHSAERVATDNGITPLEVMIEAMRYHYEKFIQSPDPDQDVILGEEQNYNSRTARCAKEYHLERASTYAANAAPFIHAKLANIEVTGENGTPLERPNVRITFVQPDGSESDDPESLRRTVRTSEV